MKTKLKKDSWEIESWETEFEYKYGVQLQNQQIVNPGELKQYIRQLIQKVREEEEESK